MKKELTQLVKDLFSPEKRLWRFYALFFVFVLLVFNWNKLYWVFDHRAVSGVIENKLVTGANENPLGGAEETGIAIGDPASNIGVTNPQKDSKAVSIPGKAIINTIYIPLLNSQAPILKSTGTTNEAYLAVLEKGVLHYSDSANPGELGAVIILGHSAPANWPDINYDNVFSSISELKRGDKIQVVHNGKTYIYQTIEGEIIDKGGDIPEKWLTKDAQRIVLLSCWPPGKDYKRYGVVGELLTD